VSSFVHLTSFALFVTALLIYHYRMKDTGTTKQRIYQNWYTVSLMETFYLMVYVITHYLVITLKSLIKKCIKQFNVIQ